MPRRAAKTSALALALLAACTPIDEPPTEGDERRVESAAGPPPPPEPTYASASDPGEPVCGAIAIEPVGSWLHEGPRMSDVSRGWRPRAEHGRPVAIREARAPFEVPGYTFWQVQVEGAPRSIQPCFMKDDGPTNELVPCLPVWMLMTEVTPEAQPQTTAQWAQLVGLLDGATAVYPDEATLDRCASDLPAAVRAGVPPLGIRSAAGERHVGFVERIDMGDEQTLLVGVHATLIEGRLEVERQELWTMDHEVAR